MTRSLPNSSTSPVSTLKGWPASATSSPMRNTRGSRRISSASASRTASPYVSSRSAPSRVDILVHLARLGVGRGQRELHPAVHLSLHVRDDPLEDALVGELLRGEPPGQRVERIVLGHPLLLLLLRAIDLAVDVADVMAVVAIGLALQERRALAAARTLDEPPHGRVDELHVLAVDALGVDPEGPGAGEDLAGGGLGAGRVLAVEVVLADVDHRQHPERGHVHHLVQEALAERAVAEEAHRDLPAAPHLRRQRGPGRDPGRPAHDGIRAEVAHLGIGDVHRAALAATVARLLAEQLREHPADGRPLGEAMAVSAMRARDEVVAAQRLADADGDGLLADVEVGEAWHLRALVELVHLLLEGADLRHLAVHVEVLLEVHPRFGHWSRHRHISLWVIGSPGTATLSLAPGARRRGLGHRRDTPSATPDLSRPTRSRRSRAAA